MISVQKVPIRVIDENKKGGKTKQDCIKDLVDQMLTFSKQMVDMKTDHEKNSLQRQIDPVDQ